ncbi:MAG: hypothetical protein CMD50_03060 [Gammaproteobacteria bacterium]|nr:hypothetical protein [Gammaproteobacteria bacterium]|tara:strand:- start:391 stop:927 length:537 start_codon:yes stop_codon:yes gene_type:complete
MKKIIFTLFLFTSINAYTLPACPDTSKVWNNCFGTYYYTGEYLGDKYIGEWKNDKKHGYGTYTYKNGNKYEGEFFDDIVSGQGTAFFSDGGKYVGGFKDNLFHGNGTETFPNGDKFEGNYKDGKEHGLGVYTWADGESETGYYINGEWIPDICKDMGLSVNSSGYEKCINRLIEEVLD